MGISIPPPPATQENAIDSQISFVNNIKEHAEVNNLRYQLEDAEKTLEILRKMKSGERLSSLEAMQIQFLFNDDNEDIIVLPELNDIKPLTSPESKRERFEHNVELKEIEGNNKPTLWQRFKKLFGKAEQNNYQKHYKYPKNK